MIRENLLYKIMSYIHITLFVSLCCMLTIVFSGTLLMLPSITAVFKIGKDVLHKKADINDSVIKNYFCYMIASLKLMRFVGVELIMLLNLISLYLFMGEMGIGFSIILLTIVALLLVFQFYIAGYAVFVDEKFKAEEAALAMISKPLFLMPLFASIVLLLFFFNMKIAVVLSFTGAFAIFALEVPIFIQMLYFRKMRGTMNEDEEFYYLVKNKYK